MFYFLLVVTFSAIFFSSLVISSLLFYSPSERALPFEIRVGIGYLFMLVFFAAGLKLLPVQQVWLLGLVLLLGYWMSCSKKSAQEMRSNLFQSLRGSLRPYGFFFLLGNVFLLPLHLGGNYGPFTEGGGDISIYADTSKYIVDHNLQAWGLGSVLNDFAAFGTASSRDNLPSIATIENAKISPTLPDGPSYSLSKIKNYGSLLFSPTVQWFFLNTETNFHIFYGVLAFQYACMILGIFYFLKGGFGLQSALVGCFLSIASQGLVSIFYNIYFLQSTCLMIGALTLALMPSLKLTSPAGGRIYIMAASLVVTTYAHYLTVFLPLLCCRWRDLLEAFKNRDKARLFSLRSIQLKPRSLPTIVFLLLFSLWLADDLLGMAYFLKIMIKSIFTALTGAVSTEPVSYDFVGRPAKIFSNQWTSFYSGYLSQQHYPPLVVLPPFLESLSRSVKVLSGVIVLLGAAAVYSLRNDKKLQIYRSIYLLSLLSFLVNVSLVQGNLYFQAKGAQNTLVIFYAVLVALPLGMYLSRLKKGIQRRVSGILYTGLLLSFGIVLGLARTHFTSGLARIEDRGTIVESSFYQEAKRITEQDPNAFTLFEPRNSSDIYFSNQPFFGYKLINLRHLRLRKVEYVDNADHKRIGLRIQDDLALMDFIPVEDFKHLWFLSAQKVPLATSSFRPRFKYFWKAEHLEGVQVPKLILQGDQYDAFFRNDLRSSTPADIGLFSYVRHGGAFLWIPSKMEGSQEITVKAYPAGQDKMDELIKESRAYFKRYLPNSQVIERLDSKFLTLRITTAPTVHGALVPLVKSTKAFWFNVRMNGQELTP